MIIRSKMSGPASKRGAAGIAWPEWTSAKSTVESGDTSLQFVVDLIELIEFVQLKHSHAKPAQHADQQKREPQLQAPAYRVWEKCTTHESMQYP
jgi:hypothetical protein